MARRTYKGVKPGFGFEISAKQDLGLALKKFQDNVEQELRYALAEYTRDIVHDLAEFTPLGNPQDHPTNSRYYRYYYWRMIREGHRIEGGLARGNWRVVFNAGVTGIVQRYSPDPSDPADIAYERIVDEYRLSRPFYIVNNVKYINKLNVGFSKQMSAGYIELIMQSYANWSKYSSEFVKAVERGTS